MNILQFIPENWLAIITSVIAVASAIAAVTPTPAAGSFLAKAYWVIDLLALNIGKAKETGDRKP